MIYLKTDEEIEFMRDSNPLAGMPHGALSKHIKPGVTTLQLDKIADEFIRDHGGVPSFLGYGGFPNSICASVNEHVVHGIPNNTPLKEGDILSLDIGVIKNGYNGDSAYTYCVGEVSDEIKKLLKVTHDSLYIGIDQAKEGNRIGDIGNAIQTYCEKRGYTVVRELV